MTPTEIRLALLAADYDPIPLRGKHPDMMKDWHWQKIGHAAPEQVAMWAKSFPDAINTGIQARNTPCLDIDILIPDAAQACEDYVNSVYDGIQVRIGLWPKRAIPFRATVPFKKINLPLIAPDGSEQKIEFLADGQQFAAFGIHPDTHQPYSWHGGSPLEIKHDELAWIDQEQAQLLVDSLGNILIEQFGYKLKTKPKTDGATGGHGQFDWLEKFRNLIDHDNNAALAFAMIASGMGVGAAINFMTGLVQTHASNAEPERKQRRLDEIPGMVRSAQAKIDAEAARPPIELGEWSAGVNPGPIKPRQWLLGNQFCRGFISSLFAAGGVGKSALRLLQFMSMALDQPLCGQHVFRRSRVLLISLEDNNDELQRRIQAVLLHYRIERGELEDWMWCSTPMGRKIALQDHNKRVVGDLEKSIREAIERRKPDIVALDPFIKLHSLEENDSGDMNFVCDLLLKIATENNIAIDIPHHVHKGKITPGDADAGRGASSIRDAGRLIYTLTVMSETEAQSFNISPDDRPSYIRLDSAKVNLAGRSATATWFHIVGVPIGNATEQYPAGDTIQVVEPWSPPDAWSGVSIHTLNAILDYIQAGCRNDDGEFTGERFSNGSSKDRAAWAVIPRFVPNKTEAQCRIIINAWIRSGLLISCDYHSPSQRRDRKGLFVDDAKRPGTEVTD